MASIQLKIESGLVDLPQEPFGLGLIGEYLTIKQARVPMQQNISDIEDNDCGRGRWHRHFEDLSCRGSLACAGTGHNR